MDAESAVTPDSETITRKSSSRIIPMVIVLLIGLLVARGIWVNLTRTAETAKADLLASARKRDSKLEPVVAFWVEYKLAGHGTWAELDSVLDWDAREHFKPVYRLSGSTLEAYHEWRRLERLKSSEPKDESSSVAKQRLLMAMQQWDAGNTKLKSIIQQIEDQKQVVKSHPALYCTAQTEAAFRVWFATLNRERAAAR